MYKSENNHIVTIIRIYSRLYINNTLTIKGVTLRKKYLLGNGVIQKNKSFYFDPNSEDSVNPHVLITGTSGAGKTILIKDIIEYLNEINVNTLVLDFHGDMDTPGENHIEYTARNTAFGINPFEFEFDIKNGGPSINVDMIVQMFKKSFWQNMGTLQESVLRDLLRDTYKYKGIIDEDESTWPTDDNTDALPTMDDLFEVYTMITSYTLQAEGERGFTSVQQEVLKYRRKILTSENDKTIERYEKKIKELQEEYDKKHEEFYDFIFAGKGEEVKYVSKHKIDFERYDNKKIRSVLEGLEPYIRAFGESNIFNQSIPKLVPGVNRFDIKGFTNMAKPEFALFFADIFIQRVFRRAKMQGTISLQTHGRKVKTYVVIDESRIVLPTGKDKSNPYHILNKIALEARKYGLGLIMGSQSASHFPKELLANFYTKIILKTDSADEKSTIDVLGIPKREVGYFEMLSKKKGLGLLVRGGKIIPLKMNSWEKLVHAGILPADDEAKE